MRAINVGKKTILRMVRKFGGKVFIAAEGNRSESDNGYYVKSVQRALRSDKAFSIFKRDPSYRAVLEHVPRDIGEKYLGIIRRDAPEFISQIEKFKVNDLVGSPITYEYQGIGHISPTTLRYMKVASDLKKIFGTRIGDKVVEIGVGYGGQYLILDQIFNMKEYHLYDLPPVLELTSKYLESHILKSAYRQSTLNQNAGDQYYDLALSNYAFSELPAHVQESYIYKILSKSNAGYLTMNSGLETSLFVIDKLRVGTLRELLPPFEVIEENPPTGPNNYIIVWGHR